MSSKMKKLQNKRRKFKKQFDIDVKLLDKLAKDEGSCVHMQTLQHHIALHPFQLNDVNSSVKEILNGDITKYSTKLDGILFGYKNVKFLSNVWPIVNDSCFVHVDLEADFFIFRPVVGKTLQGVVKKQSKDHVGCVVHNIFNVAIARPKRAEDWLGDSVDINSEILFTVIHTNFEGCLPYIKGEIVSILSNPVKKTIEAANLLVEDEGNSKRKKSKKAKKLVFEDNENIEMTEETSSKRNKEKTRSFSEADIKEGWTEEAETSDNKKSKKRKKSVSEKDVEEVGILAEEFISKKGKKRRKSISELNVEEPPVKRKRKKSKSDKIDDD